MTSEPGTRLAGLDSIVPRILVVRGRRILVDADLARLYGVATKRLNEQVRRNPDRFPDDFVFRLSQAEMTEVVANCDHLAGLRFHNAQPLAFTEHGALMAASVLNSPQAVRTSVLIVRAFVALRHTHDRAVDLMSWLRELDRRVDDHEETLRLVVQALEAWASEDEPGARPPIGFHNPRDDNR